MKYIVSGSVLKATYEVEVPETRMGSLEALGGLGLTVWTEEDWNAAKASCAATGFGEFSDPVKL